MVMPCSRSARRPSVTRARSRPSPPRFAVDRARASSWSSKRALVSCSKRPISVLLPSSTEPAVVKRSRSVMMAPPARGGGPPPVSMVRGPGPTGPSTRSKIPLALAVLHGRLREPVVGAGGTSLGHPAGGRLGHDLLGGDGVGPHGAGARHVADRAVAHRLEERLLVGAGRRPG